jgi:hypothetical protein
MWLLRVVDLLVGRLSKIKKAKVILGNLLAFASKVF